MAASRSKKRLVVGDGIEATASAQARPDSRLELLAHILTRGRDTHMHRRCLICFSRVGRPHRPPCSGTVAGGTVLPDQRQIDVRTPAGPRPDRIVQRDPPCLMRHRSLMSHLWENPKPAGSRGQGQVPPGSGSWFGQSTSDVLPNFTCTVCRSMLTAAAWARCHGLSFSERL